MRVILTRDDDRPIGLDERAAIANNSKADLFLSLHVNAAPSPAVAGAEVFHLRLDREGEDARRAAEAEAVSLPVLGGATRAIDVIQWDLAQARHVDASAVLAGMLEQNLRTRHDGAAARQAGAASRAHRREHAGRAHRDGVPHQRRAGEGLRSPRTTSRRGTGHLRRDRRLPRATSRTARP